MCSNALETMLLWDNIAEIDSIKMEGDDDDEEEGNALLIFSMFCGLDH